MITLPITKDTNIKKLIDAYPDVGEILTAYGLHCSKCFANKIDTLGGGAKLHRFSTEEFGHLLRDLNSWLEVYA